MEVRKPSKKWKSENPVSVEELDVPQFRILNYSVIDRQVVTSTGSYQRLTLSFLMKRSIGYFLFQTYLPTALIVNLSFVSFWINHNCCSARIALGITTVLTLTTISTAQRQILAKISYIKAVDVYLVFCFMFVLLALIEFSIINYLNWEGKMKESEGNEKWFPKNEEEMGQQINFNKLGLSQEMSDKIQMRERTSNSSKKSSIREKDTEKAISSRQSSPIPCLVTEKVVSETIDTSPTYPRYITNSTNNLSTRQRLKSINFRHRLQSVKNRGEEFRNGVSRMGAKAASGIPKIVVKDINDIDRVCRCAFPVAFIIFKLVH
uniref:Neur_chan_memb domain-containing protein n=1 Tax=Rhabditophanes sp. KR3021 TaxID=114890 RepID=A0AC35UAQ7_9BILA